MSGKDPLLSVIVASYNQPATLRLVLQGLAVQGRSDFEVIIADDGSGPSTFQLLHEFALAFPYPLRWVTQPDRGFRKARILNRAVATSRGGLLVFCDGDCLPLPGHLECYRRHGRPGAYLVGGVVYLDLARSRELTLSRGPARLPAMVITARERHQLATLQLKARFYALIRKSTRPRLLGGNFAVSRQAFCAVNGFDEGFDGLGGEDTDLRNRLNNYGAQPIPLWDKAVSLHLDHGLDQPRCPEDKARTGRDRQRIKWGQGRVWVPLGLDQVMEAQAGGAGQT